MFFLPVMLKFGLSVKKMPVVCNLFCPDQV